jgi:general secretion pathway protein E
MGIEPYLISSSVIAVMAQRLLRIICPQCKVPYKPEHEIISLWNETGKTSVIEGQFHKGLGCENCLQTGYLGRTGIFELLVIDDDIRELIGKRLPAHIIKQAAIEKGMTTLREDGLHKALAGQTTLEEVCRVTQDTVQIDSRVIERVGS